MSGEPLGRRERRRQVMAQEKPISPAELLDTVEQERKRASVRALDISLNELADMYINQELNISPAYQRTFRWSLTKQSQFIESIILEMPLPPIYVVEVEEGKLELIDGLQRLSSYLHFRGQLRAPDHDPPIVRGENALVLEGCDVLLLLNGLKFEDLPTSLQYRVRRSPLRVEVVRRETNPRFAYHMFKRLNTGGEALSEQEVRNCTIRLLDNTFNEFLQRLSQESNFQTCIEDLPDDARARMGQEELTLRFLAFKNNFGEFRHDVGPFMTRYMERVSDRSAADHIIFDYAAEEMAFRQTFALLAATLGPKTCERWTGRTFGGGFSNHHFEAFSLGVGRIIDRLRDLPKPRYDDLQRLLEEVKKDTRFRELTTGGGKNSPGMYDQKIRFVTERILAWL
jgi:hypothetical protein